MPLRFKLDENLPRDAETLLVDAGHDARSVTDEGLGGRADSTILDVCLKEDRVLVTLDLDFADIRLYPPSSHRGIWVLRPETQSIENTISALRAALALLGKEPTANRLWIVEASRVRIRE
jgi:predicted nuclease of predicted toxin-antitoxin system